MSITKVPNLVDIIHAWNSKTWKPIVEDSGKCFIRFDMITLERDPQSGGVCVVFHFEGKRTFIQHVPDARLVGVDQLTIPGLEGRTEVRRF